jgi:hypothetical protein
MQKDFTNEMSEPDKKENAFDKMERKVGAFNPINRLNPF